MTDFEVIDTVRNNPEGALVWEMDMRRLAGVLFAAGLSVEWVAAGDDQQVVRLKRPPPPTPAPADVEQAIAARDRADLLNEVDELLSDAAFRMAQMGAHHQRVAAWSGAAARMAAQRLSANGWHTLITPSLDAYGRERWNVEWSASPLSWWTRLWNETTAPTPPPA